MAQIFNAYSMEKTAAKQEGSHQWHLIRRDHTFCDATCEQLRANFIDFSQKGNFSTLRALLSSHQFRDATTTKLIVDGIPLSSFMPLCKLIRDDNLIAPIVAIKLNSYDNSVNGNLSAVDQNVVDACLSAFADRICDSRMKYDGFEAILYRKLGLKMQNVLKDLLMKRYTFPTLMSLDINNDQSYLVLPAEELVGFCRAERTSDGTFYFFDREGSLKAYSLKNVSHNGLRNRILEKAGALATGGCVTRVSFKNNHDWALTGDGKGIIRLYAPHLSKNKNEFRIRINPLSHWGSVTTLGAYGTTIVAAYQSGALEMFDLKEFDDILQDRGEKQDQEKDREFVITCTTRDTGGRYELAAGLEKNGTSFENNYCKLLIMNETYVIGAYRDASVKVWKDRKLYREISLPRNSQIHNGIGTLYIFNDDRVAVGCLDGTAYVVDLKSGTILHTITGKGPTYNKSVSALTAMGAENRYLVVGHKDGQVYIWDLTSKMNRPFKIISRDSCPIGINVSRTNKALLEIIYVDAVVNYVFIPEIAELEDIIKAFKVSDTLSFD